MNDYLYPADGPPCPGRDCTHPSHSLTADEDLAAFSAKESALQARVRELEVEREGLKTAILEWWAGHRPISFSASEHRANPQINLACAHECRLADLAATLEAGR